MLGDVRDARFGCERHPALGRVELPGNQLQQRGLARAIAPDQGRAIAHFHAEIDVPKDVSGLRHRRGRG